MKVKLEKKEQELDSEDTTQEADELPDTEVVDEETEEDVAKKLEIENARLQGKLEAMEAKPKTVQDDPNERARIQLLNDSNSLDDETFEKIYRAPKHQVMATFLDQQLRTNQAKTNQKIAESEARMELASKYGKDVSKYRKELNEALEEASPEVRRDPERLAAYLERQYLAFEKAEPVKKPVLKKEEDVHRRKIVQDFAKPGVDGSDLKKEDNSKKDELKDDLKQLGSRWGIETETERKKYLGKVVHVDMDFGSGVKLTKTGFEKVAAGTDKK